MQVDVNVERLRALVPVQTRLDLVGGRVPRYAHHPGSSIITITFSHETNDNHSRTFPRNPLGVM